MKSPSFCAIINLLDYDSTERGFFMSRKNPAKNINIGLLAHVDAGKTTLSEALLYATGQIRALGRVDHQDAFLDTDVQERARGITIFSKQARLRLQPTNENSYGEQTIGVEVPPRGAQRQSQPTNENLHSKSSVGITILDTPGHVDFSAEMERTLQVLDYAILVISGTDGVQGHTRTLWRLLRHYHIPTFLFVNKMDLPGADKEVVQQQLKTELSDGCVDFTKDSGEAFFEEAAMGSEALLDEYMDQGSIAEEHLANAVANRDLFPCYYGSALKVEGVKELLAGFAKYHRAPEYEDEFSARVYKIGRDAKGARLTYLKVTGGTLHVKDRISYDGLEEKVDQIRLYSGEKFETAEAVEAGEVCAVTGLTTTIPGQGLGAQQESSVPVLEPVLNYRIYLPNEVNAVEMMEKLKQLEEEDPQLHILWNEQLQEIHAQMMGQVQIEVLTQLIKERFGVVVVFGQGNIVYKETIAKPMEGVGHFEPLRHYAEVHLLLEPLPAGSGLGRREDVVPVDGRQPSERQIAKVDSLPRPGVDRTPVGVVEHRTVPYHRIEGNFLVAPRRHFRRVDQIVDPVQFGEGPVLPPFRHGAAEGIVRQLKNLLAPERALPAAQRMCRRVALLQRPDGEDVGKIDAVDSQLFRPPHIPPGVLNGTARADDIGLSAAPDAGEGGQLLRGPADIFPAE